jgi:hypothetical protein
MGYGRAGVKKLGTRRDADFSRWEVNKIMLASVLDSIGLCADITEFADKLG